MCEPVTAGIIAASSIIGAGTSVYGAIKQGQANDALAQQGKDAADAQLRAMKQNGPQLTDQSPAVTAADTTAKLNRLRLGLASTIKTSAAGLTSAAPVAAPALTASLGQ